MRSVKKVLFVAMLVLLTAFLPGCWDRREVEDLAIAVAMGVDLVEVGGQQLIRFVPVVVKPGEIVAGTTGGEGGGGSTKGSVIIPATGKSVWDAERNWATASSRKLYLPHAEVIIIGERYARAGVGELVDFLERKFDMRLRPAALLVFQGGEALDALKVPPLQESTIGQEIQGMLGNRTRASKSLRACLCTFSMLWSADGVEPFATRLVLDRDQDGKPSLRLDGAALFNDDRLVGWLSPTETRGLLWVRGEVPGSTINISGIIVVPSPADPSKMMSLEISKARSRIRSSIENGRIVMRVEIEEEGILGEMPSPLDLLDPAVIAGLEKAQDEVIASEVRAALEKAQSVRSDVFGFGEILRRQHPEEWQQVKGDWRQLFAELQVEVVVNSRIAGTGTFLEPATRRE